MKLYHFTTTQNLLLVSWNGLKPGANAAWQTGRPCVWLTRQESNVATAADVERCAGFGVEWEIGAPVFGGPERVTVHLERHDRKLVPYRDVATAEARLMGPYARSSWWVYFGDIPPSKIAPITIAQAVASIDIQISVADDVEQRAHFVKIRSRLLQGGDLGRLVTWRVEA